MNIYFYESLFVLNRLLQFVILSIVYSWRQINKSFHHLKINLSSSLTVKMFTILLICLLKKSFTNETVRGCFYCFVFCHHYWIERHCWCWNRIFNHHYHFVQVYLILCIQLLLHPLLFQHLVIHYVMHCYRHFVDF